MSGNTVVTGGTDLDILGIGAATLDDLWLVRDFDASEGVRQALAHVTMGGGPVATALTVMACLGRRTALVDVCGDDPAGGRIVDELRNYGVAVDGIQQKAGAISTQAVIQVRAGDGARQIVFLPCSAGEPVWSDELARAAASARVLHLNGRHESVAREAVRVVKGRRRGDAEREDAEKEDGERGVISFDGGAGRYRESIRDLVEASQLRVVSREFAACYTGAETLEEQMRGLCTPSARWVVITDGVRGSHGSSGSGVLVHQPAHPVSKVVDTTGCGDVYHGAFLHGYLAGWDLPRCMGFASRLAARNAVGLGGRHVCLAGDLERDGVTDLD